MFETMSLYPFVLPGITTATEPIRLAALTETFDLKGLGVRESVLKFQAYCQGGTLHGLIAVTLPG